MEISAKSSYAYLYYKPVGLISVEVGTEILLKGLIVALGVAVGAGVAVTTTVTGIGTCLTSGFILTTNNPPNERKPVATNASNNFSPLLIHKSPPFL